MSNVIPIISITTSEMEQAYEMCYMGGHPKRKNPIFISEPGAGKSWMTRNIFAQHVADCRTAKDGIARELSLFNANPPEGVFGVVPLNLGTSEPTDIGVPAIWWNGDDPIQKRAVYEALPRSGEGLLVVAHLLDECGNRNGVTVGHAIDLALNPGSVDELASVGY